jgi:hypothetical protein
MQLSALEARIFKYDEQLSKFAFNIKLRRYIKVFKTSRGLRSLVKTFVSALPGRVVQVHPKSTSGSPRFVSALEAKMS